MLWGFVEIISKPGAKPWQGASHKDLQLLRLHRPQMVLRVATSSRRRSRPLTTEPGQDPGCTFSCLSLGRMEQGHCQAHIPTPSDHQQQQHNRNPIESRLPPPSRWRGVWGGVPWSSHIAQSASVVKTQPPTGSTRPRNTGPPTP